MIPLIGENIIANIFKSTAQYMPFMSLQSVAPTSLAPQSASLQHYITVSLAYIAVGLVASAVLFKRRDAN